ncbi:MAG: LysM peptidoglycan-binding domain-containing protein [Bacteroidota bacterium]|nr:LysM peptidoglycan-binding domain-containing protein [Bacteroidota bacterium]
MVQKGDTLYSISKQYNTTVARIKSLNNLDSNALSIGQTLILISN